MAHSRNLKSAPAGRRSFLAQAGALAACWPLGNALGCRRAERIDTHQHFWKYDPKIHPWIQPRSEVARDFTPEDLRPVLAKAGVAATLVVESWSSTQETDRLLRIAKDHSWVVGVVGWLPLVEATISELVARYAANPKMRGVRHAVVAEPDPKFLQRPDFNRGVRALTGAGLSYDLLVVPRNLPAALPFVDAHPNQRFVLDHLAKPLVRDGQLEPWRKHFTELAKRPNVYCKLSGLVNEANHTSWTPKQLQPYLEVALEAFTPHRLMFGSDWPMCLMASSYQRWTETLANALRALSASERSRIWAGTAREAYQLS